MSIHATIFVLFRLLTHLDLNRSIEPVLYMTLRIRKEGLTQAEFVQEQLSGDSSFALLSSDPKYQQFSLTWTTTLWRRHYWMLQLPAAKQFLSRAPLREFWEGHMFGPSRAGRRFLLPLRSKSNATYL